MTTKGTQRCTETKEAPKPNIRTYQPEALKFLEKRHQVLALLGQPKADDWTNLLQEGKDAGLIPSDENWTGNTICVVLGEVAFYVNRHYIDYEQWSRLSLFENPPLEISDRPHRYILPVWARYLLLP